MSSEHLAESAGVGDRPLVRPCLADDIAGMREVWSRAGFAGLDDERFMHHHVENPAVALGRARGAEPVGWVLESGGQIRGVFGNLLSEYDFDGRSLLAATTTAVAVDPAFRGHALALISRFFRQRGVDLLLATTANNRVSPIYRGFRAEWVPHPEYGTVLCWLLDRTSVARSALTKRGSPALRPLAHALGAALWIEDALLRRLPTASVRVESVERFGPEFDDFWHRLRVRPKRLLANRSAATLEWHFARCRRRGGMHTLVWREGGRIEGYCVVARVDSPKLGMRRAVLADLQILEQRREIVLGLLSAAISACAKDQVHVLETRGFEPFKRAALESTRPRRRTSEANPFLFLAPDAQLAAALSDPSVWDPCPYDGDSAI